MTDEIRQNVKTSSAAAGVDSTHTKNRTADDDELGQGLKAESETNEPLFMKDTPEGHKGNPQDEKDETEE